MSKKTKTNEQPIYDVSSDIYVNGNKKASASSGFGGSSVSYEMDPYEKLTYDYTGKAFYDSLPNVNVFSEETLNNLNKEVEAYLNKGTKTINSTYVPMIMQTQNDIARRFGNTDNSIFLDKLKDIESMRASAVSELADSVESKRSELVNNELNNRYDYLNFLNSIQNQIYSNMLSMLDLNNDYLNTNNSQLNGTKTNKASNSGNTFNYSDVASAIAKIFNSIS